MAELVRFYTDLYSLRATYNPGELQEYLSDISLPKLTEEQWDRLEAPITEEELLETVALFPGSKAPGDDGLTIEVYQHLSGLLLPKLLEVFQAARETGAMPESISRASIVLLLKPDKPSTDPGSYRPISLLQADVKLLAKVLARRVNTVITHIIHEDQAGFMPNRSTALNLRRLFVAIQTLADNTGERALLSLDANKAFDSEEWDYLWAVMETFGFGPVFMSWARLLYHRPQASIREEGRISARFGLGRGTRQGFPCSYLL